MITWLCGILVSYGSMAYTEAYQARYRRNPHSKYDTQAELLVVEKQLEETHLEH